MKQHITIGQLNALSEKGRGRLLDIFVKKDVKLVEMIFGKSKEKPDLKYLKETIEHDEEQRLLLSIGQMIEFLDSTKPPTFPMKLEVVNDIILKAIEWPFELELCDSLWEAVKQILEKN